MSKFSSAHRGALLATVGSAIGATAVALSAASLPAGAAVRHATIPTPPKNSAAAALVPKAITKNGTITFAADATYAPDEFVAANGHTIQGMDVDLGNALASVLGLKAKFVNATFDTIIPSLKDGRFDVGLSSFTITAARETVVNFVSYFQAGEGFYVKASGGPALTGLTSLCGKKVAVESGTTEQSDAQKQIAACKKAGKAADSVLPFDTQSQANLAVSSGRADLGFADSQVAAYIVQQSKGTFKLSGHPFAVSPYGIAFPKTGTLDKASLAALKVLMSDGIYKKVLSKWGVQNGAITTPAINPAAS
ncbi:MAG: putative ABC-type amino acid transport, periplasmic component [Acidimicrobiaceae bacterium]|nr:putative ABC-type amino acid transport, periplasmic component [Acidimicrobiaceae bacterium]